jgi:hypothetical protein
MATRPLAFGLRFRDKGRTLRVRAHEARPNRYVIEDSRGGNETRRREHPSLAGALRDFATTWRHRLH